MMSDHKNDIQEYEKFVLDEDELSLKVYKQLNFLNSSDVADKG
jgi:hypothetical protein